MTGGRGGERGGLLRYCWMNGPQGRRGMGWRGFEKMNMTGTQEGKKEQGGKNEGRERKENKKMRLGRSKENGRQGGQTGHVKGSLCLPHA